MKFEEIQGDLFSDVQNKIVAHCISENVTATRGMAAGIAKTFRQKYPAMASTISPDLRTGKAIRYAELNGNVIYNLVSKQFLYQCAFGVYESAYYDNLKRALIHMRDQMLQNNEQCVAMPRVACGIDQGKWDLVSAMIKEIFATTEISIRIFYL